MRQKKSTSRGPSEIAKPVPSVPTGRPKIQDVATEAGVSLGTISAVLNGNGRISDSTRVRVQQAIEKLGYRPDLYASNLARRTSQLLGVVVSNLQNPFFAETAQAIEEEAARFGFQISLMTTNFSPSQQRAVVAQLLGARIAGLAVITSEQDQGARQLITASNVPAVFLDIGEPSEQATIIRVDSQGGMQAAVKHLLDLGHRDILYVRNSQKANGSPLLSHELRDQGFEAAVRSCKAGGLKSTLVDMPGPGADAGEAAIASVFGKVKFSAVVAVTDTVAMGVYRGLQARGVQIPRDVSVVGFDNTYFSRFLNPPLTTVDVPRTELSRAAVCALMGRESQRQISLPTTLIVRESTAAPNSFPPKWSRSC
jgi:DNA-binding LacI/PurR family transcriptional regulator